MQDCVSFVVERGGVVDSKQARGMSAEFQGPGGDKGKSRPLSRRLEEPLGHFLPIYLDHEQQYQPNSQCTMEHPSGNHND